MLFIGATLLSRLNVPAVRAFEDSLRENGRSPTMIRYVVRSHGALLADAGERGLVVRNVVRDMRGRRRRGSARQERRNGKLKVGVDIPTPGEIKAIINEVTGRYRPLLLTAIFTGLRASELRGLRWEDVDLKRGEIHVRQRADRYNEIGPPKTKAGEHAVSIGADTLLAQELRIWKLRCPKKGILASSSPTEKAMSSTCRIS